MKQFINVQGTQLIQPLEIEVNIDTVYVRSNIQRIETEDFAGWQYDEKQYGIREYLELISNKQNTQEVIVTRIKSATEIYEENKDKSDISLTELKQLKMNQLDELCNKSIIEGFDFTINGVSYRFSCSITAQANFQGTDTLFKDGIITDVEWTVIDNSTDVTSRITLDKDTFDQIRLEVFNHINANISKLRNTLQPQVESATSNDEVNSIVW